MTADHRRYPRHMTSVEKYFEMSLDNGGTVINLGEGGFGCYTDGPLKERDAVKLAIWLGPSRRLTVNGRVVWTDPNRKAAGVEFEALPEDSRRQILEWFCGMAPEARNEAMPAEHEVQSAKSPDSGSVVPITSGSIPEWSGDEQDAASQSVPARAGTKPPTSPAPRSREVLPRVLMTFRQRASVEARGQKWVWVIVAACVVLAAGYVGTRMSPSERRRIGAAIIRFGDDVAGRHAPSSASQPESQVRLAPLPRPPSAAQRIPARVASQVRTRTSSAVTRPSASPQNPAPPASRPLAAARNAAPRATVPGVATSSTAGEAEFLRGRQFLLGVGVEPDPVHAAEWFWSAVGKGNTAAEVMLADLYLHGTGVTRSCLQARVLLTAAAQKGNAEAASKLEQLPENCE